MAQKAEKIVFRTEEWLKIALEDLADEREIPVGELIRDVLARSVRTRRPSPAPLAALEPSRNSEAFLFV